MSIHPSAIVDPAARIEGVEVGPFTIIHGNVEIGAGSKIGSHCEIGHPAHTPGLGPLVIGTDANIRSHSVFYEGSTFGEGLSTGHGVTVRDGTAAGKGLQIGRGGDIQGDCTIGDYTRMQSNVVIGKMSRIGNYVWLFPRASLLNDPTPPSDTLLGATLHDFAVVCAHSVILPGAEIGIGALVGAMSNVTGIVPAHRIVCGNPAIDKGPTSRLKLKGSRLPAYPWTRHFHRGYPEDLVAAWLAEAMHLAA